MRFIPTKFHAPLDYIVGAALIVSPWIFSFSDTTAPTVVSIVLGIGLIVHSLIDIVAGAFLALSPWLFGFADDPANVWIWFVVVGLAAIFLGLTTKQSGGYSYGRAEHPATG